MVNIKINGSKKPANLPEKIKSLNEIISSSKARYPSIHKLIEDTKKTTESLSNKIPQVKTNDNYYFGKKFYVST